MTCRLFPYLEPQFMSIIEKTEIKLEDLLGPRMIKIKTEIEIISTYSS